jgi:putative IMPACT (imprinted ancient) family translation regulator
MQKSIPRTYSSSKRVFYQTEAITVKKSKFIASAIQVHNDDDVKQFMNQVKSDKKFAQATHNILAYRYVIDKERIEERKDDDGEIGAAEGILQLMRWNNINNVAICVTRWYGGIHLGNDRFKMVNQAAKQVLQDMKLI